MAATGSLQRGPARNSRIVHQRSNHEMLQDKLQIKRGQDEGARLRAGRFQNGNSVEAGYMRHGVGRRLLRLHVAALRSHRTGLDQQALATVVAEDRPLRRLFPFRRLLATRRRGILCLGGLGTAATRFHAHGRETHRLQKTVGATALHVGRAGQEGGRGRQPNERVHQGSANEAHVIAIIRYNAPAGKANAS